MNWYTATNSDYSGLALFNSDKGLVLDVDDGGTYSVILPSDHVVCAGQNIRLITNISNGSKVEVYKTTYFPIGTESLLITITNSSAVHFMYDGTNERWRIVSDNKIRAIEDEEHPLTALSGNKIKDQDGDLIEQAGVEVVGINSINGNEPFVLGDNIDIETINSKTPILKGDVGYTFSFHNTIDSYMFQELGEHIPTSGDKIPILGLAIKKSGDYTEVHSLYSMERISSYDIRLHSIFNYYNNTQHYSGPIMTHVSIASGSSAITYDSLFINLKE